MKTGYVSDGIVANNYVLLNELYGYRGILNFFQQKSDFQNNMNVKIKYLRSEVIVPALSNSGQPQGLTIIF